MIYNKETAPSTEGCIVIEVDTSEEMSIEDKRRVLTTLKEKFKEREKKKNE